MNSLQTIKKPITKKLLKRGIPLLLFLFLLYLVLGSLLPFLHHKKPSRETAASFSAASYRGTAGDSQERVACIDDPQAALEKRLQVIRSAQKELIYTTYEIRDDESGKDILCALLDAADRGVQVRLLTDGLPFTLHGNSPYFKALAAHENAEIRIYNPLNALLPWKAQLRMHDKYIIADDHTYMLGGRNSFDLFLGNYSDHINIDRELLVYSPAPAESDSLNQLRSYFETIWAEDCTKPYTPKSTAKKVQAAAGELRERFAALPESSRTVPDWAAETYAAEKITLISGETAAVNKEPKVWYALSELMAEGSDVLIETPYIILSDRMERDLTAICRSADKVEILLNAVENGANPFGCVDYLNQKKNIWATGASVYEYCGNNSLHTKTVLIDEDLSIVGSFNMDMRSAYLDTELMLAVDCPQLNAELRQTAAAKQQSSRTRQNGSYVYGPDYQHKNLSLPKKIIYQIMRVIVIPIRHLM